MAADETCQPTFYVGPGNGTDSRAKFDLSPLTLNKPDAKEGDMVAYTISDKEIYNNFTYSFNVVSSSSIIHVRAIDQPCPTVFTVPRDESRPASTEGPQV